MTIRTDDNFEFMAKKFDTGVLTEKTSNTEEEKARRFTRKHRPAFKMSVRYRKRDQPSLIFSAGFSAFSANCFDF